ncbi:hypothetical protein LLG95_15265 [bacterium]|nr:hypothetical protein [bacterium]
MYIAYTVLFIGLFCVIGFVAAVVSTVMHWDEPDKRVECLEKLYIRVPALFFGVGAFCFTIIMMLWTYGTISPTETKTFPMNNNGAIHYVNAALHHSMWVATGVCVLGFLISLVVYGARKKKTAAHH